MLNQAGEARREVLDKMREWTTKLIRFLLFSTESRAMSMRIASSREQNRRQNRACDY